MKTNVRIARAEKATTQEKIDMLMAVIFIAAWTIRAFYSPYHY